MPMKELYTSVVYIAELQMTSSMVRGAIFHMHIKANELRLTWESD